MTPSRSLRLPTAFTLGARAPRRLSCPQRRPRPVVVCGWRRAPPATVPPVAHWAEGALEPGPAKRGAGRGMEAPERGESHTGSQGNRPHKHVRCRWTWSGAGGARRTRRRRWPTSMLLWQGQHGYHHGCASCDRRIRGRGRCKVMFFSDGLMAANNSAGGLQRRCVRARTM
jgi:hypothetical protein